jgi:hypothetical protein
MGLNGPGTIHSSGTGFSNYRSTDWFWNIGLSQLVYGICSIRVLWWHKSRLLYFLFTNLPIGLPFTDRYHRDTQAELVITIKYLGTFGKTLITL